MNYPDQMMTCPVSGYSQALKYVPLALVLKTSPNEKAVV